MLIADNHIDFGKVLVHFGQFTCPLYMNQASKLYIQTLRNKVVLNGRIHLDDITAFPANVQIINDVIFRDGLWPWANLEHVWSVLEHTTELCCVDGQL